MRRRKRNQKRKRRKLKRSRKMKKRRKRYGTNISQYTILPIETNITSPH